MNIIGHHFIAGTPVDRRESGTFAAENPAGRQRLDPEFCEATDTEVNAALDAAADCFAEFRSLPAERRATLLEAIANEVENLGDALLTRANLETGLPIPRLKIERTRATSQARAYAQYLRDGLWRDARIDVGQPERENGGQSRPKPDVRSYFQALGPTVVFGASNFPIAISVVGADSVAALGTGCPIVVKGHPAHPGTSELLAIAVNRAVQATAMPAGVFSLLQGTRHEFGAALVRHPKTAVVAFTGSLHAGRALANIAAARPIPIPFYGELGSVNPIFVLPGAMADRGAEIAQRFVGSLNMGVGQFCTNPGLLLARNAESDGDHFRAFADSIRERAESAKPATMLHAGIHRSFHAGLERLDTTNGVTSFARSTTPADPEQSQALCAVYETDAENLISNPSLKDEIFGPVSVLTRCDSVKQMTRFAATLDGSLTATIHGNPDELAEHSDLVRVLEEKVGRLIFNGFPTGIELCDAMHHGGPYPATTHAGFTSIGTRTISKFGRPVCSQDFPDASLPPELQNANPLGIPRMVNGKITTASIKSLG